MNIQKGIDRFMSKWVNNMKKITPVGKRPRPASARKLYTNPLKESIEYIDKGKPIIQMNLYGMYVNSGHRTRGTKKLGPNPAPKGFIRPSFDDTFDEMESDLPDAVFDAFDKEFEFMFKNAKIG